jgi:hypothetical protein
MPKSANEKGLGRRRHSALTPKSASTETRQQSGQLYEPLPELDLIYDTAQSGLRS